jgi:hypothetical protein
MINEVGGERNATGIEHLLKVVIGVILSTKRDRPLTVKNCCGAGMNVASANYFRPGAALNAQRPWLSATPSPCTGAAHGTRWATDSSCHTADGVACQSALPCLRPANRAMIALRNDQPG